MVPNYTIYGSIKIYFAQFEASNSDVVRNPVPWMSFTPPPISTDIPAITWRRENCHQLRSCDTWQPVLLKSQEKSFRGVVSLRTWHNWSSRSDNFRHRGYRISRTILEVQLSRLHNCPLRVEGPMVPKSLLGPRPTPSMAREP